MSDPRHPHSQNRAQTGITGQDRDEMRWITCVRSVGSCSLMMNRMVTWQNRGGSRRSEGQSPVSMECQELST